VPGLISGRRRLRGRRPSGEHDLRRYPRSMDRPPPDPRKLLDAWMDWESGEATPGRVMSQLKTGGLRVLLEAIVAEAQAAVVADGSAPEPVSDTPDPGNWSPVV
jgi:hypothetical protein